MSICHASESTWLVDLFASVCLRTRPPARREWLAVQRRRCEVYRTGSRVALTKRVTAVARKRQTGIRGGTNWRNGQAVSAGRLGVVANRWTARAGKKQVRRGNPSDERQLVGVPKKGVGRNRQVDVIGRDQRIQRLACQAVLLVMPGRLAPRELGIRSRGPTGTTAGRWSASIDRVGGDVNPGRNVSQAKRAAEDQGE